MRKTISLILALLMLVVALVSCTVEITPDETEKQNEAPASQSETPSTQAPATQTEAPVTETEATASETEAPHSESATVTEPATEPATVTEPASEGTESETVVQTSAYTVEKAADYADLDFGGKTFNIIYRWSPPSIKPSGWGMTFDCYIDENNPDDAMSAAVKLRNSSMAAFYNCTVIGTPSNEPLGEARTAVQAGDATYDLCLAPYFNSYCNGEFYNIMSLINTDYDCWDQALIRDLALGGKIYGMAGDCTTAEDDYQWVIYFNKAILRENNLEDPYQLVYDGKWTLAKLYEMARECKKDLDGDLIIDSYRDIRGLVARAETCRFFWQGAGVRIFSEVQDDGNVKFIANSLGNESDIYKAALDLLNDDCTGGFKNEPSTGSRLGYPDSLVRAFTGGHCAFMIEGLYVTTKAALDETDGIGDVEGLEWGLLPCPKYSEDQTEYYNFVWTQASYIGIPISLNLTTASNFLNVYGLMMQSTVQKAFNNNIAYAYSNDSNVADMLDIVYTTRVYDASYWYASAGIDTNLVQDCAVNKNRWASRIKSGQSTAEQTVADYYRKHMSHDY
ncbi:MAG: hypothetical protein J5940_00615, partial [Clostridia bacterium]|nr:hypothetical protein [Clostridia bacterium]